MGTPSLWHEQHPAHPRPRLQGEATADVCIVGAGITGSSCAWRLLEHGLGVVVLDAREPAAGASGRNGGFAVTGTGLAPDQLAQRLGPAGAIALHTATGRALDAMAALAAELGVPEAIRRTGSLWLADADEAPGMAQAIAAARAAGIAVEGPGDRIPEPMRDRVAAAAFLPEDAELLPARFVRTLADAAASRGATLFDQSPAGSIERAGEGWRVDAGQGAVLADAVVVACDGLIGTLLPELAGAVYPVRGQVAATEPLAAMPLRCPTHSQYGFMYYRPTADGRVVVGGGRLEHLEDEYTADERTTAAVQGELDRFLRDQLGLDGARVTHRWAGIMGFSADLLPLAGPLHARPGVYVAGGYSGVGNVLGHHCGVLVADLIATGHHPDAGVFDPARLAGAGPGDRLEQRSSRELAALIRA